MDWLIILVIAGASANQPAITQIPFRGTQDECLIEARRLKVELMPRGPGTFYIDLKATCIPQVTLLNLTPPKKKD